MAGCFNNATQQSTKTAYHTPKPNGGYKSNQNSKINGRNLIIRKKNPDDGRCLIYLTELGKEKETYQKMFFKIQ
jgi:hypothetical protein